MKTYIQFTLFVILVGTSFMLHAQDKLEGRWNLIIEKDGHHIRIDSDYPMFFENDTIGQFTGLHDKNGVEIYENDKVFDGKYHGIIEYRECSFVINWEIDCSHDDDLNYWNDKIEVIGNIHERSD